MEQTKVINTEESYIKDKLLKNKRKEALLKHLAELRNLVLFIDTKLLKNRQERRAFWSDFVKSEKSRDSAILALLNHFNVYEEEYEKKIDTKNEEQK